MSRKHRFLTTVATATLVVIGSIGTAAYAPQAAAVPAPGDFNWTQIVPGGGSPAARCYGAVGAYNPANDTLVMHGGRDCGGAVLGDTWWLTNATGAGGPPTWVQVANGPARNNHSAAYDAATDTLIVFGGCLGGCSPTTNDTWLLQNATGVGGAPTWVPLPAASPPPPRQGQRAFYDPSTNRMMVFGGQDGSCCLGGALSHDVWVLTNANGTGGPAAWSLNAASGGPPPGSYYPSGHYSPVSNILTVTMGGDGADHDAIWVLLGANGAGGPGAWGQLAADGASGFVARSSAGYASDMANDRLMMFGGGANTDTLYLVSAGGTAGPPSYGGSIPTTGGPPPSGAHFAAYDPTGNVLMVFVTDGAGTGNEVWKLSNGNGIVPPPPPTAVQVALRGRFKKTPINIRQKGRVPMTVFGSASFNVNDIDQSSVTFGATGTESTPVPGTAQLFDVNKDGQMDLILQFPKSSTATPCGTTSVTIKGDLISGGSFQGSDSAKVVPCAPPPT